MHLRVDPDMALSRLDVYPAAHCIIRRPILLFRKWEEVSRAIIGVNMWSECVEFSPHHFRAAQAHALASRPRHGAESPRRVLYCCTLHHSSNIYITVLQVRGYLEDNNRRRYVVGVCRMLPTPLSSCASACTCERPGHALSRRWRRCRGPRRWRASRWSVRSCACEAEKRASPCATSGAGAGGGAMQKKRVRVCEGASEEVRG